MKRNPSDDNLRSSDRLVAATDGLSYEHPDDDDNLDNLLQNNDLPTTPNNAAQWRRVGYSVLALCGCASVGAAMLGGALSEMKVDRMEENINNKGTNLGTTTTTTTRQLVASQTNAPIPSCPPNKVLEHWYDERLKKMTYFCGACGYGKIPTANQLACQSCPLTQYQDQVFGATCQACPSATPYQDTSAAALGRQCTTVNPTSVMSCPAGNNILVAKDKGGLACHECSRTTYPSANGLECLAKKYLNQVCLTNEMCHSGNCHGQKCQLEPNHKVTNLVNGSQKSVKQYLGVAGETEQWVAEFQDSVLDGHEERFQLVLDGDMLLRNPTLTGSDHLLCVTDVNPPHRDYLYQPCDSTDQRQKFLLDDHMTTILGTQVDPSTHSPNVYYLEHKTPLPLQHPFVWGSFDRNAKLDISAFSFTVYFTAGNHMGTGIVGGTATKDHYDFDSACEAQGLYRGQMVCKRKATQQEVINLMPNTKYHLVRQSVDLEGANLIKGPIVPANKNEWQEFEVEPLNGYTSLMYDREHCWALDGGISVACSRVYVDQTTAYDIFKSVFGTCPNCGGMYMTGSGTVLWEPKDISKKLCLEAYGPEDTFPDVIAVDPYYSDGNQEGYNTRFVAPHIDNTRQVRGQAAKVVGHYNPADDRKRKSCQERNPKCRPVALGEFGNAPKHDIQGELIMSPFSDIDLYGHVTMHGKQYNAYICW